MGGALRLPALPLPCGPLFAAPASTSQYGQALAVDLTNTELLDAFGRLLADLGIGASLVDRELRLTWCNPVVRSQWLRGPGDGPEHCFALQWDRSARCADCLPILVFETGEPREGYRERHRPGQSDRVYRVRAIPARDAAGRLTHVLETYIDVTDLGRAIATARLDQQLSSSLAAAGHGVLVVDPRGRIVSWSASMDAILGYGVGDVLGRGVQMLLPPGRRAEAPPRTGAAPRVEMELVARDGRFVPVAVAAVPIGDEEGELCGHQWLVDDLSEVSRLRREVQRHAADRARLDQQMVRSEKLAAVGSLAAGLAHEIGTPLNVISASAEYALLELAADHPAREDLATIVDEVDRIRRLVSDLLGFARGAPPAGGATRPRDAVDRVLRLLRAQLERRRIRAQTDLPDGLPPVAASGDALHQLLLNVLMNSVAAVADAGRIFVAARAVELPREGGPCPAVAFAIADNGPGIPPAMRQRVFDPFFTTRPDGTGLGLTVCNRIVTDHGGAIHVGDSELGGALVEMTLPAAAGDDETALP